MPEPDLIPDISVVICSYNGAAHLPALLASLGEQTFDSDRFETVVVDDGSSDSTSALAREHGARVVTLAENVGLAAARNAGVRTARASIVAFTDDDCVCDPGWLAQLIVPFADPAVLAVGGGVTPAGPDSFNVRFLRRRNPLEPLSGALLDSPSPPQRLAIYLRTVLLGAPSLGPGERLYSVVGANMAFRRKLLETLGGFDEAFRFGSEEEELCVRIHARGEAGEIIFAPWAMVTHTFAPRVGDTLRRSRAYGRGNARATAKYGKARLTPFPAPLLIAAVAAAAVRSRSTRLTLATCLLPLLCYPRWVIDLAAARRLEPFAYPYLQLAQELLTVLGEVEGRRAGYRPIEVAPLTDTSGPAAQRRTMSRVSP
jgi:GT2 family glycosyltransferase